MLGIFVGRIYGIGFVLNGVGGLVLNGGFSCEFFLFLLLEVFLLIVGSGNFVIIMEGIVIIILTIIIMISII